MEDFLEKQDYEEPCCPLVPPAKAERVPIRRIIEKLGRLLSRDDKASAQAHLKYWLAEADMLNDLPGKLSILNELIGFYRKAGNKDECIKAIKDAFATVEALNAPGTVIVGTTYLNSGTAYKAFGDPEKALSLYEKAAEIYESEIKDNDARRAGLYNNMAITLAELKKFTQAKELYGKALKIMSDVENGEAEMAITFLNLADLAADELGAEEAEDTVEEYLKKAKEMLDTESLPRDGYYAFVCEKCASVFGYYGHFIAEQELKKRAEDIYERN